MKPILILLILLALFCLWGCGTAESVETEPPATEPPSTEPPATEPETVLATTVPETSAHEHAFTEKIESDAYLARAATGCGERPTYYMSCTCGEHGDKTFRGEPIPHKYGVSVSDDGLIGRVYCTVKGCGHTENLNLQLPKPGTFRGAFSCTSSTYEMADSAKVLYFENCTTTQYDEYIRFLLSNGCTQAQRYTMGSNIYTLFRHEKFTAYLSYLAGEGAIRVYVGRSDDPIPNRIRTDGSYTPALWQINVDCKTAGSNGGMSYVLQLSDGTFIVIDGGYETASDANSIYQILCDNKPEEHEKPIISGWFLTHLHIDHFGAFRRFSSLYQSKVVVKGFYYNFPYVNVSDIWPSSNQGLEEIMSSWEGATLYRKLHSGMQIGFAGARVTVLCTYEDVYPLSFNSGNDTSTVFKIEIAGQTILFLGDAEYGESDRMYYLPDSVLSADIMQYAHHGYDKQCRNELYMKIAPSVVLWPMPIVNWESGTLGEVFRPRYYGTDSNSHKENSWVRSAAGVKKIIVMAEGTTKLELPYTPTGPRNADYEALYREQIQK